MLWRIEKIGVLDPKERRQRGEALACAMLQEYTGRSDFSIARTEAGKPYAPELSAHFSITHAGEWLACAVSDRPIGIDMEIPAPRDLKVARKVCTEGDLCFLAEDQPDALTRFYEIWTAKEAYFKALGTGITNLKSINYSDLLPRLQQIKAADYIVTIYQ